MTRDETARELEKLRAEIAALKAARQETPAEPTATPPAEETATAAEEISAVEVPDEAQSKLEELSALLETEIRELPAVTCLVVFALGIIMGRMMR